MNKNDYLKLAILDKKFYKKSWLISIISQIKPFSKPESELEHLEIITDMLQKELSQFDKHFVKRVSYKKEYK